VKLRCAVRECEVAVGVTGRELDSSDFGNENSFA
jgi:hypothetical protein